MGRRPEIVAARGLQAVGGLQARGTGPVLNSGLGRPEVPDHLRD